MIACSESFLFYAKKIWAVRTDGPIYSSPCVATHLRKIFVGSHDGNVYCFDMEGTVCWKHSLEGVVFSSPSCWVTSIQGFVAVCSTKGDIVILDEREGKTVASYHLDGELFSSPVLLPVYDEGLTIDPKNPELMFVVGCRDNHIYSFKHQF